MFPFFHSDGNIPFSKQSLKMSPTGLHIDILQIGNIRMLIFYHHRMPYLGLDSQLFLICQYLKTLR